MQRIALIAGLFVAIAGCAGSSAPDDQPDASTTDSGVQRDGLVESDSQVGDDAAAQADGATQSDGATQDDGAAQNDGAAQLDGAAQTDGAITDATAIDGGGTTRTLSGTMIGHYLDDTTTTTPRDEPTDLSTWLVEALVWGGAAYTTYAGTGDASGHFTVPNVPTGTYLLNLGGYYFTMSTDTPNLDFWARGRAGLTFASAATTVNLGSAGSPITNLVSWYSNSDYDQLIWFCSNNDSYGFVPADLNAGATQLAGVPFDLYTDGDGTLLTTADQPLLLDLAFATGGAGDQYYAGLRNVYTPTPFNLASGGSVTLSGAFVAGTHSQTTSVNYKRSEFHAGRTAVFPSAAVYTDYVSIFAQPGGLTHGAYTYATADLMNTYTVDDLDTDIDYGTTTYDNPFPASYGLLATGLSAYTLTWTATGATTAKTLYGVISSTMSLADFTSSSGANGVMHAIVTPPRSLLLNGNAATSALTGVTTTPTLSWTAPATGTPNSYVVSVYRVANGAGTTTTTLIAVLRTTGTSLPIPSGLLETGNQYGFRVGAVSDPGNDYTVTPQQSALPYGYATAFTALATP